MIGIGITTRNRPSILRACLLHLQAFCPDNARIVIVDDSSDTWQENADIIKEHTKTLPITYRYSPKRLGIAKAKNACLASLSDCQNVFLFDDDAWPSRQDWADRWLTASAAHNVGHSSWNTLFSHMEITATVGHTPLAFHAYNHCLGVCLHFSRACLDAIGGYDPRANLYGYEHAQVSQRAAKAGFTLGHKYLSPALSFDLIYSLDIHKGWFKIPPLMCSLEGELVSSCPASETSLHENNAFLLQNPPIYIPLEDPILCTN